MKTRFIKSACAASLLALGTAWAGSSGAMSPREVLKHDLAQCEIGAAQTDRRACQREAHAAYAESLRGGLADHGTNYERNARMRCEALQGEDRSDCLARMQGQGQVSGSVAEGGVLRSLTTRTVQQPPTTPPRP